MSEVQRVTTTKNTIWETEQNSLKQANIKRK